ncbi:MAG: hypothetical protein HYX41_02510 [Bdellovibrio sp.]|nr:hypothetical protein [Bdellovibrio sp.]
MKKIHSLFYISLSLAFCWQSSSFADLPGPEAEIILKRPNRSFNHLQEFALEEEKIFVRKKNDPAAQWTEIQFEPGPLPFDIKADGANLMVRDAEGYLHYKKVLKEERSIRGVYSGTDISQTSKWKTQWYNLPVVRWIARWTTPNRADLRLRIPPDSQGWAVSHRGKYNRYFEDRQSKPRTLPLSFIISMRPHLSS